MEQEQKRRNILLAIVLVLALVVVLRQSSIGTSVANVFTGNDLKVLKNEHRSLVKKLNQSKMQYEEMKKKHELTLAKLAGFFISSDTLRNHIQLDLVNLAKSEGLEKVNVSAEKQKALDKSEDLTYIDYKVSVEDVDYFKFTSFLGKIEAKKEQYLWTQFRLYQTGKKMRFSGLVRIFLIEPEAMQKLKQVEGA